MTNRLKRLREYLTKIDLDCILIAKPENRTYFSGFTGSAGVLLVSMKDAKLLTDFRYVEQAVQQAQDFTVVRHGSELFADLDNEIRRLNVRKVGFEGDFTTWDIYRKLAGIAAEPVAVQLDELRVVKDPAEIALVKKAVQLADNAFTHVLPYMKPGVSEFDIALELEFNMRQNGAEKTAFDIITASGKRSALPHGRASEKTIEVGDLVTMDFGAVYKGYHSDITRTVVIGQASTRQREMYNLVLLAQLSGLNAVKPGETARNVDAVAREIIVQAGYGDYFGHGLGHGVGLAIHEEPRLSPTSQMILAPGMVITVEPGVYLPDWGGIRIEDTVVVTTAGAQVLSASTKELIELDW